MEAQIIHRATVHDSERNPSPLKGWLLLAGLPLVPAIGVVSLSYYDDLHRECAHREFETCYVSVPLFAAFAILMVGAFVLSARLGASPVRAVAARPLRFCVLAVLIFVLVWACYMIAPVRTEDWWGWTRAERFAIMGTNLAIVAVTAAAFQTLFPFGDAARARPGGRITLAAAISFWGYLFFSLLKMWK